MPSIVPHQGILILTFSWLEETAKNLVLKSEQSYKKDREYKKIWNRE